MAPMIVVGEMYENRLSGIFVLNKNGIRKDAEVTNDTQIKYSAKYVFAL